MRSGWVYRTVVLLCVLQASLPGRCWQLGGRSSAAGVDTDGDGLSDAVEQALLERFTPQFWVGEHDCSNLPAEFARGMVTPKVDREDGTIYGQVFPSKLSTADDPVAEVHFYHLWRRDCGEHGHKLDTEHVAVLIRGASEGAEADQWRALYWYAAAHENTVCDVSQIAKASTLGAETHGAKVWVSPGKHASYLSEALCKGGCGGDRCVAMIPIEVSRVVNLGEAGHPMNQSAFIASKEWPLEMKMVTTNFTAESMARLNGLPADDIAWFHAGRHPVQGVIAVSASTGDAILTSGENTSAAIGVAGDSTGDALDQTGDALEKSYTKTKNALGRSARAVGKALHVTPKPDEKKD